MLKINVGGRYFITQKSNFLTKCIPNYFSAYLQWRPNTDYIFVDKNPKYFEIILDHVRGYTTTIPTEESELIKLYEDSNFYGIQSLVAFLEETLQLRMSDYKRDVTKTYIRESIQKYNIKNFSPVLVILNQLSDKQLLETKIKVDNIINEIKRNEDVTNNLEVIMKLSKKIELTLKEEGISQKVFERKEEIVKLLKNCDESSFKLAMVLLECIV